MRNIVLLIVVSAVVAISAVGCAGTGGYHPGQETVAPLSGGAEPGSGLAGLLPSPRELEPLLAQGRRTAYTESDLSRNGAEYQGALPHAGVSPEGSVLKFSPSWPLESGEGLSGLAYALYAFNLAGYDRTCQVGYTWSVPPGYPGSTWIGLANWEVNRWDWYPGNIDGLVNVRAGTPPLAQYINATHDLLVAVLRTGTDLSKLAAVKIGTQLPVAVLNSEKPGGLVPCEVTFDPGGSYDPDGSIRYFEYDFEGDGTVDLRQSDPAPVKHTYTEPGAYDATLIVTDEDGGSSRSTMSIGVSAAWAHSWGSTFDQLIFSVVADASGNIYATGSNEGFSTKLLLEKYSPAGELLWAKSWGGNYYDFGRSITLSPQGDLIVAGATAGIIDGAPNGLNELDLLTQRWTTDGELVWSRTWGNYYEDVAYSVVANSAGIFVVGHIASIDTGTDDMGVLRYDYDGNLAWIKAWGNHHVIEWNNLVAVPTQTPGRYRLAAAGTLLCWPDPTQYAVAEFTDDGQFLGAHTWSSDTKGGHVTGLCTDQAGNLYIAGHNDDYAHDPMQATVISAVDPDWNTLWQAGLNTYPYQPNWHNTLVLDSESNLCFLIGNGGVNKYSLSGNLLSMRTRQNYAGYAFNCVAAHPWGGLVAGGRCPVAPDLAWVNGDYPEILLTRSWCASALQAVTPSGEESSLDIAPEDVTDQGVIDTGGGRDDAMVVFCDP